MTIKAVCFDADGVVINPQMQFAKHLEEVYDISPEITRNFFGGVFNDCLVGKTSLQEIIPKFLEEWGWKDSVAEFIHTWLVTEHNVDNRVIDAVRSLRQNRILCCLATSQEHNRAAYMKTEMGFQDLFDHLFFSCDIGWQKPHHAYYQHIEKELGLEKNAILFLDDSRTNVESACDFGWHAEIYTDFKAFQETIEKYLIIEKRV